MKIAWLCLVSFLNISLVSCNGHLGPRPEIEQCITNGDGTLSCTFQDETYIRPSDNDICTNPDDYATMEEDYLDVRKRLEVCLASPKRCK
jgi:hypothetical protein